MRLTSVDLARSPVDGDRVRLYGEVRYDSAPGRSELYWFDVPERQAESLTTSGNPWLACLVSLAATLGEPLHIGRPVDPTLYANVQQLLRIWREWHPHLHPIAVEAELEPAPADGAARTGAFFTGGVDSMFTALRHRRGGDSPDVSPIDELLWIWGWFDALPRADREARLRIRGALQAAARDLDLVLVDVETNLRETRWRLTDYVHVSHGSATAAVGLTLERRYANLLVAASQDWGFFGAEGEETARMQRTPYGSHPRTDPLLSTSRTRVTCDGASYTRIQKTEVVAASALAMRHLRVCWHSRDEMNCGVCTKCFRVMATLAVLGALERCRTFPGGSFDLRRLERLYCHGFERKSFRVIAVFAVSRGRPDVAAAMRRSVKRSERIDLLLTITWRLCGERVARRALAWLRARPRRIPHAASRSKSG